MTRTSLDNSAYYINREVSWLAFNRRVLEEAEDPSNPPLERVKFLSITASNLDEFFEVRVAGLVQQIEDGYTEAGPDGLTLLQERDVVSRTTHEFVDDQYQCWNEQLRPLLAENGIRVLALHELDAKARAFVEQYCERELDLLLTPVTVDPVRAGLILHHLHGGLHRSIPENLDIFPLDLGRFFVHRDHRPERIAKAVVAVFRAVAAHGEVPHGPFAGIEVAVPHEIVG